MNFIDYPWMIKKIFRCYTHTQIFFKFKKVQSFYSKIINTILYELIVKFCDNVVAIEETMKEYKYFLYLRNNKIRIIKTNEQNLKLQ